jgi:hypothetical protein
LYVAVRTRCRSAEKAKVLKLVMRPVSSRPSNYILAAVCWKQQSGPIVIMQGEMSSPRREASRKGAYSVLSRVRAVDLFAGESVVIFRSRPGRTNMYARRKQLQRVSQIYINDAQMSAGLMKCACGCVGTANQMPALLPSRRRSPGLGNEFREGCM